METENDDKTLHFSTFNTFQLSDIPRNEIRSFEVKLQENNVSSDDLINYELADKPANSYIISKAGVYKISTKVTPNGSPKQGSSAVWLWASKEGGGAVNINDMIGDIQYSDDSVKFKIGSANGSFNKGNVILALKNAQNKIVWTWHLWLTDQPDSIIYENQDIHGNKIRFMDRNLGALTGDMSTTSSGIDNYGFVYQWGRKDPFYGGNGVANNTSLEYTVQQGYVLVNQASGVTGWSVSSSPATNINDAVENPMKFYINNNTALSNDEPADWLATSNTSLWSENDKTEYDPCPFGYKIPSTTDLKSLYEYYNSSNISLYFRRINNKYWTYHYVDGNKDAAWQSAGMRRGRSVGGALLVSSGTDSEPGSCFYWTASPVTIPGVNLTGGAYRMYTMQTASEPLTYTIPSDEYGDKADAYPVRCVKIHD